MRNPAYLLLFLPLVFGKDFIVNTSKGRVRGKLVTSRRGPDGVAFLGIPMAEPPVASLRFKEAVEPKGWSGVSDALYYREACLQDRSHIRNKSVPVGEDCLHINVFSSRGCLSRGGCAVMAFVHGGTRWHLSPERTPEENVINNYANEERNIVYVGLPFRLGILAWLNLAPEFKTSVDSNIGNRDVLTGLHWIQREIGNFGGDPSKVTLVGHSSGAQLVSELLVSPVADGLFSQISMWSVPFYGERTREINTKYSRLFAKKMRCAKKNETFTSRTRVSLIENCMRGLSTKELLTGQELMKSNVEQMNGVWVDGPGGIFSDTFANMLKRKFPRRNYLIGTVSAESKGTRGLITENGTVDETLVEKVCEHLAYEHNYDNKEGYQKACTRFYSRVETAPNLNDDQMYYYPTGRFADKFSQNGSCFVYSFEYPVAGERFTWNASVVTPKHAEELKYLLWGDYDAFTEADFSMETIFSGIVANFVTMGDPSYGGQSWRPWTREGREYFIIDFDENLTNPGARSGYYREVSDLYDVQLPREAGSPHPLLDLPARHDCFFQRPVVDGLLSLWLNLTLVNDKEPKVSSEIGKIWALHFQDLLKLEQTTIDWTPVIAVVVFLLLAFGLCFWSRRNTHKGYTPLPEEF